MKNTNKQLIIGSNSFLGRSLSKQLFKSGENVLGVFHKNTNRLFSKIKHQPISELQFLEDDFSTVYIISSYIPKTDDSNIESRLQKVNIDLVTQVQSQFKKAKLVFCSSVSVYGEQENVITEITPLSPISAYGKSKKIGEEIISNHKRYSIVRISSMYGKQMNLITFLPLIIKNAIDKKKITVFGEGKRLQNYIYVNDVTKILIKASKSSKNAVFLAVNKKSYSNLEIVNYVAKNLKNIKIEFTGKDSSKSYIYNNSYTMNELNLKRQKKISKGIKKVVQWMRKES